MRIGLISGLKPRIADSDWDQGFLNGLLYAVIRLETDLFIQQTPGKAWLYIGDGLASVMALQQWALQP